VVLDLGAEPRKVGYRKPSYVALKGSGLPGRKEAKGDGEGGNSGKAENFRLWSRPHGRRSSAVRVSMPVISGNVYSIQGVHLPRRSGSLVGGGSGGGN